MSQEPNLAEILKSPYQHKALIISEQTSKRLGTYSGIERREPEAKSRRNLAIKITSIRQQQIFKKVSDLALTPGTNTEVERLEPGNKSRRNLEI